MRAVKLTLRRAVLWGLHALGLEMVSSKWAFRAGLRPDFEQLIRRLQPGTILDVGANAGQFYDFLRRSVRYDGDIVSFEPIPSLADDLRERAEKDPRWNVEAVALGAKAEHLDLNVSLSDDFSSFRNITAAGTALFPGSRRDSTVGVPVITLDDYLARTKLRVPFILKLDTQGYDLEVLKGGENALQHCMAILCEVSVIPLYEGQPDWTTTIAELNRRGFGLVGLYPVTRTKSLEVIEFDCLMVRVAHAGP